MYHMFAGVMWRPEEYAVTPGTVAALLNLGVGARNPNQVLCKGF